MNCKDVRVELSCGAELSPDQRAHFENCAECRAFGGDLAVLRERVGEDPTPDDLEERTLGLCRSLLAEKAAIRRMSAWKRFLRLCDSPTFVATAAVLALLLLGALVVTQADSAREETAGLLAQLAVLQFVVQNLVTVLFVPALFVLRKGSGRRPGALKPGE